MKPILIGLVFLCGQPMFAQVPSRDAFIRDYRTHEESLFTKYCFNRKVVFTVTVYNLTGETTELRSKVTSTEVSSSDSLRTRGTVTIGAGSSTEPLGSLRTGGSTYLLGRGKSADVFGIKSHRAVHNPTEAHPGFGSSSSS